MLIQPVGASNVLAVGVGCARATTTFAHQPSRRQALALLLPLLSTPTWNTQSALGVQDSKCGRTGPPRQQQLGWSGEAGKRRGGCQPGAPPRGLAVLIILEKLQSVLRQSGAHRSVMRSSNKRTRTPCELKTNLANPTCLARSYRHGCGELRE